MRCVYGYAAIARVQLVQGAGLSLVPPGMVEGQAPFAGARADNLTVPSPAALNRARGVVAAMTEGVADEGLRSALERLAQNVLGRTAPKAPGLAIDGKDTA